MYIQNLAYQHAYLHVQPRLPANQWQIEASIWFSTCLAKEQAWAVEWATYPRNLDPTLLGSKNVTFVANPPTTPAGQQQCSSQMIRDTSGAYTSFSVLGMGIILVVGGLLILVGLCIDIVAGWLTPRSRQFMKEEWEAEDTLALHQAAYAGLDFGIEGQVPPSTIFFRGRVGKTNSEEDVAMAKNGYIAVTQPMGIDGRDVV
jgi:hypothetical protein